MCPELKPFDGAERKLNLANLGQLSHTGKWDDVMLCRRWNRKLMAHSIRASDSQGMASSELLSQNTCPFVWPELYQSAYSKVLATILLIPLRPIGLNVTHKHHGCNLSLRFRLCVFPSTSTEAFNTKQSRQALSASLDKERILCNIGYFIIQHRTFRYRSHLISAGLLSPSITVPECVRSLSDTVSGTIVRTATSRWSVFISDDDNKRERAARTQVEQNQSGDQIIAVNHPNWIPPNEPMMPLPWPSADFWRSSRAAVAGRKPECRLYTAQPRRFCSGVLITFVLCCSSSHGIHFLVVAHPYPESRAKPSGTLVSGSNRTATIRTSNISNSRWYPGLGQQLDGHAHHVWLWFHAAMSTALGVANGIYACAVITLLLGIEHPPAGATVQNIGRTFKEEFSIAAYFNPMYKRLVVSYDGSNNSSDNTAVNEDDVGLDLSHHIEAALLGEVFVLQLPHFGHYGRPVTVVMHRLCFLHFQSGSAVIINSTFAAPITNISEGECSDIECDVKLRSRRGGGNSTPRSGGPGRAGRRKLKSQIIAVFKSL
ncbi:hypothetical protein B0H13DRAFT_2502806 [Mycena leptocephala]|nr:hypothetical protein B0H13DRAFT_2502806 [Mycena leptocephala]